MIPAQVLHLLGTAKREGTGIARMVAGLARGLDSTRYSVHAWFLADDGPSAAKLRAAGAKVRVVPWKGIRADVAGAWRFWRCLRGEEFAIIHQHYGGRGPRFLARAKGGARIILHLHGSTVESKGFSAPISAWGADTVIAVSHRVAQEVAGAPAHVVYPGIPIPETSGIQPRFDNFTSKRIVGAACRLVPIKAVHNLIRAIVPLRAEVPDVHLEIAGAGPEETRLKTLVRTLGLADCVTFLGWQEDLAAVMARWAVFAIPSLDEGVPIALLEAMAASLPVVATAVGGVPEVVENSLTGWLVSPNDPAALADRLGVLLLNLERRRAMGAAGRARARAYFSIDRMVVGISKIYDGILHPSK